MRTNMMGELYLGPDDDLVMSLDDRGKTTDVYARLIEYVSADDGPVEGWACEIAANADGEPVAYLEGFEDEQAIREYIQDEQVEIV